MSTGNRTNQVLGVVQGHIANALEQLRVAQPGLVESYDDKSGRAEVVPLLKRPFFGPGGTVIWQALGKLSSVPVVMPIAGGRRVKLPVQQGDVVLLIFCDFSLDGWKAGEGATDPQGVVTPPTLGAHQVADAIAIPGLFDPLGDAPAPVIEIKSDGTVILAQGTANVAREGDAVGVATSMADWISTVTAALAGSGPAVKVPLAAPTDFGTIAAGNPNVKA